MSVEHVLPQTWTTYWPLPDGRMAPADKFSGADEPMLSQIRSRDAVIHTLGNLTLITVSGNSAASNSCFPEKRPWLNKSLLGLNLEIIEKETWGVDEVVQRADSLADRAVQIWPAPG